MASPDREWPAGTETRHSDGSLCVLLNDGDWARVIPPRSSDDWEPSRNAAACRAALRGHDPEEQQ